MCWLDWYMAPVVGVSRDFLRCILGCCRIDSPRSLCASLWLIFIEFEEAHKFVNVLSFKMVAGTPMAECCFVFDLVIFVYRSRYDVAWRRGRMRTENGRQGDEMCFQSLIGMVPPSSQWLLRCIASSGMLRHALFAVMRCQDTQSRKGKQPREKNKQEW